MKQVLRTTLFGVIAAPLMYGSAFAGSFDIDAVLATDLNACKPAPSGSALKIGYAADFSDLGGFAD